MFVWGPDLKSDLKLIDERNKVLPAEVQEKGIMTFAPRPPTDGAFLTTQIWDKMMAARWRNPEKPVLDQEAHSNFVARMKRLETAAEGDDPTLDFTSDEADALLVKRRQHKRKGHWYQLPKDFSEK